MKKLFEDIKNLVKNYVGFLFIIIIINLVFWLGSSILSPSEKLGIVKVDNCTEVIEVKKDSFDTFFGSYVCNKYSGLCVDIKYDKNGRCQKAKTYLWEDKINIFNSKNNKSVDLSDLDFSF